MAKGVGFSSFPSGMALGLTGLRCCRHGVLGENWISGEGR